MTEEVGIAQAVAPLRAELVAAAVGTGDAGSRCEVGPVELEFSGEMRREGGRGRAGQGGVKARGVSADTDASVSEASVHRVTVVLTPKDLKDPVTGGAYDVITERAYGRGDLGDSVEADETTGDLLGSRFGEWARRTREPVRGERLRQKGNG